MEINKQLFEDVLAGKLKGTFVLRNGFMFSDKQLDRNHNWHAESCPYRIRCRVYRSNGVFGLFTVGDSWDIIDFIPDTDMKELTIEIPQGKEIDWDESKKQNKIVLKDKQLTYEDVCNALYKDKIGYYTDAKGNISSMPFSELDEDNPYDSNNASTEHQLKCILAKNKLTNVAKYLNDEWKPDKGTRAFAITYYGNFDNKPIVGEYYFGNGENLILFKTQKAAQQAIEILGEETIKLALEPLGI